MEKEIRDMNVKELKALAKERGIKRYYWLRKAQLIESLETETPPTEAPETEIMEALHLKRNQANPPAIIIKTFKLFSCEVETVFVPGSASAVAGFSVACFALFS